MHVYNAFPFLDDSISWCDAAFDSSLKINESKVPALMVGKKSTGQHASPGFCIYLGQEDACSDGVVAAKDLWRLIAAGLIDGKVRLCPEQ